MKALRPRLEKHEQADGVALLRLIGAEVYISGTRRRRGDYQGTMQTPGIPDVEAFLPDPYAKFATRRLLKWEVKSEAGISSSAQAHYEMLCQSANIDHVVGPFRMLKQWLRDAGYLSDDGTRVVRPMAGRSSPASRSVTGIRSRPSVTPG
jgi:hypothetical protein